MIDKTAAEELEIWLDNTRELAELRDAATMVLAKHVKRGDFDGTKAPRAYRNVVWAAAMSYNKEFGSKPGMVGTNEIFPAPTRDYLADEYARWFVKLVNERLWGDLPSDVADMLAPIADSIPVLSTVPEV